ncbi:bifunctional 5,10-methylene-tetrahydrofolate dehydrogenase/5,10-methylene-tetrahydrofolate cyclohydrolase [Nonomuraea deserti]|uniref:Bifunctional protein FolD n=1 Tax=Nonomuraea deserti TaxID=1848322 RepID=A0A4R4TXC8_9ACTN|nr:tetrahydrofolate dehydrogenase/cyclohydrolase catalytic domain-containing protein [Nonomuraea deserti]TDC83181.1 bifunctional 5,10-methylene-tetrahydrofolate dehydrogenase/5,10-methylene-tetrahydrofolate cyclohydrolase [Nonomuraea deserti]
MSAQVIDGRACARALKESVAAEIEQLREGGVRTGLATVMVGNGYSSSAYERRLRRLASDLDVTYFPCHLPATISQDDLVSAVGGLNAAADVSGILVLRPLPAHISEAAVFQSIDPVKDIEAVHPENAGRLALGVPRYVPSTAASAFHLLDSWLDSAGEDRAAFYHRSLVLVVGRSNNVGKPAVSLAYDRQAAVESVDEWASRTGNLGRHTRRADVLIVAAGRPGLIGPEHVNDHAVVIDVGINPRPGPGGRDRMVGDVDYEAVAARVRAITPVPGGVGPVTDVWLLRNTAAAARALSARAVDGARSGGNLLLSSLELS